ncbi:MAG: hypothetical protein PHE17_19375 [Thiothrix sp.]|jgi:hypothetical protein|uniref:hypothetical protein n=1 Tax=Thiothrix sp. TaxID=1032 RepID=UPI002629C3CC|nr:hypothetical protein [Thiothrix sp.]MDD5395189.1 hypothetical protein [Thiothrix sp.]
MPLLLTITAALMLIAIAKLLALLICPRCGNEMWHDLLVVALFVFLCVTALLIGYYYWELDPINIIARMEI